MSESKLNVKQTFLIGIGFLSCMLAWMVYNFQMPIIFAGKLADDGVTFVRVGLFGTESIRQLYTGIIMTLDNILAIVLQPYFGKLSDRMQSKYGRRTPFMIIGIPVAAASLFILPLSFLLPTWVTIFLSFIGITITFNLAMAFYRAPIVALLPDMTPKKHLSMGNAIINLMGGIGTAIGFVVPVGVGMIPYVKERIVSTNDFATQNFFMEDMFIFGITGALLIISLVLFLIFVREVPTGDTFWKIAEKPILFDAETQTILPQPEVQGEEEHKTSVMADLKEIFHEEEKSGVYILLAIFSWFFGYNALEANFSRWTQEFLLLKGALISQLFLALPVALVAIGIPAAKIAGKLGRRKTIKVGIIFMIVSLSAMIIVQEILRKQVLGGEEANIWGLAAAIAIMGAGWALININSITIVWQIAPKEKLGAYTGLYYLFSQLAAILSPIAMGAILTVGEIASTNMGLEIVYTWRSLLPFMLISMIFAYFFMARVKRGEAELSEEEIEELQEKYGGDD